MRHAQKCRGGNNRSGKCRRKSQRWKMREWKMRERQYMETGKVLIFLIKLVYEKIARSRELQSNRHRITLQKVLVATDDRLAND